MTPLEKYLYLPRLIVNTMLDLPKEITVGKIYFNKYFIYLLINLIEIKYSWRQLERVAYS